MKKISLLLISSIFCWLQVFSQTPEAFNYQSIIKNADGDIIANQNVSFRISILEGDIGGAVVYAELHNVETNNIGMVSMAIGGGDVLSGDFSAIAWGDNQHFMKIELDIEGGTAYNEIGTMQMISVPYALYAKDVANKDDADADPTNEMQNLSINNNELTITDGNTVILPEGNDIWTLNGNNAYYLSGNVGIGKETPVSKLEVKGDPSSGPEDPLFQVINKDGDTVFAVFPDGVQVYVDENAKGNIGGFAVSGRTTSKQVNDYLRVTPDSVRVYLNEDASKGNIGGFAVSGRTTSKELINYFNVSVDDSAQIINPSRPALLWYPSREAFLSGRVLVEHPDSVGYNSMATGYESKAIGNTSQAFGYQCVAKAENATAMGYKAKAHGPNSFALGDGPYASGISSFAFGEQTIAIGDACLAIGARERDSLGNIGRPTVAAGIASMAIGVGAIVDGISNAAIGIHTTATGAFGSGAIGPFCSSTAWGAIAIGFADTVYGKRAMALGAQNEVGGDNAVALGSLNYSGGFQSTAIGGANIVIGNKSTAIGMQNQSAGENSIVMGTGASDGGFNGCFVYSDNSGIAPVAAADNNQFIVKAAGGTTIFSSPDLMVGISIDPGNQSWLGFNMMGESNITSEKVEEEDILIKFANMPLKKWRDVADKNNTIHYAPIAEDFNSTFGLNAQKNTINYLDIDGINMAAIKALEKRTRDLQNENDTLKKELEEIKKILNEIKKSQD